MKQYKKGLYVDGQFMNLGFSSAKLMQQLTENDELKKKILEYEQLLQDLKDFETWKKWVDNDS